MMNSQIRLDKYFPRQFILLGYILALLGMVGLKESVAAGLAFVVIGLWFALTPSILEMDSENRRFRLYPFLFGIRLGKWRNVSEFTEISVLNSVINETTYGGRTSQSVTTKSKAYEICLLNSNHQKKLVVARFRNKETASNILSKIAGSLNLRITNYNPVISKPTRNNRK